MLDWFLGKAQPLQKTTPSAVKGPHTPTLPPKPAPKPAPNRTYQYEDLCFHLRVNRRAKRLMVRMSPRGEILVTAPSERHLPQAIRFAIGRADWIRAHQSQTPSSTPFYPGQELMVLGQSLRLEAIAGPSSAHRALDGKVLQVGGPSSGFSRRVERWLKIEALRELTRQSHALTQKLGLRPPQVKIGDAKGRWGSCSPHSWTLRYNWRLILTPGDVFFYLVAHEVAHLIHPNHSEAFWQLVKTLGGDVKRGRGWLRQHGAHLHALGQGG